jgi:gluconokinase
MTSETSHGALVIMGISGCGKSTVGRLLAARLRCSFIEGDDLHSKQSIAKMSAGQALSDDDRWPWLDRLGNALNAALIDGGTVVASCSALKRVYRDRLRIAATAPLAFILLDIETDELRARLTNRSGHFMSADLLQSQLELLERPARSESALIVTASALPGELCDVIEGWLATRREIRR